MHLFKILNVQFWIAYKPSKIERAEIQPNTPNCNDTCISYLYNDYPFLKHKIAFSHSIWNFI